MLSSMKMMEEYMESGLSAIFQVKLVITNLVIGPTWTHLMHSRVKECQRLVPVCVL